MSVAKHCRAVALLADVPVVAVEVSWKICSSSSRRDLSLRGFFLNIAELSVTDLSAAESPWVLGWAKRITDYYIFLSGKEILKNKQNTHRKRKFQLLQAYEN